ncbi:unnamed protein product [Coregonus sp. 'balchen']|nr:unnamed protein product [Coregonus sp. 'balchen']
MGGGGQQTESGEPAKGDRGGLGGGRGGSAVYTWEEVQRHSHRGDQWLVIDRKVYNVTQWVKRHPGGIRVISHFAGEDATEAFSAFHPDPNFVRKFLKPLLIGALAPTEPSQDQGKNAALVQDFQALRDHVEREGLLRARPLFFSLYLGHILLLEALALGLLWVWGTSWSLTLLCSLMLATSQGASANWWNHRHFQHHAKPNVLSKDPDINSLHVFVLGDKQPVEDLAWSMTFYLRFFCCYYPFFGFFGSVALISFVSLFPTMPRHNYHLVAPLVRALCEKHGVPYQVKTMQQGLTDVVRSLKKSGDLWLDAYLHK